jgi:hypothetical protein
MSRAASRIFGLRPKRKSGGTTFASEARQEGQRSKLTRSPQIAFAAPGRFLQGIINVSTR